MSYNHYTNAHRFREAMGQPVYTDDPAIEELQIGLLM